MAKASKYKAVRTIRGKCVHRLLQFWHERWGLCAASGYTACGLYVSEEEGFGDKFLKSVAVTCKNCLRKKTQ